VTAPNPVIPGASLLVTRRILDGRFHLRPDAKVNQAIAFALAYSASKHGIELYSAEALSNHCHEVIRDPRGAQPLFRRDFHQLVTRSVNVCRGTSEAKWSPDRNPPAILADREAVLDAIAYNISNAAQHDLVDKAEDWPGFMSRIEDLAGPPQIIRRPEGLYDPKGDVPETIELRFVKPAALSDMTDDEYRAEISRRVELKCAEARDRRREADTDVLGRDAILAADPEDRPSEDLPLGQLKPTLKCKDRTLRIAFARWIKAFRKAHRAARELFDAGEYDVAFPVGTFLHLQRYGVTCKGNGPPEFGWVG